MRSCPGSRIRLELQLDTPDHLSTSCIGSCNSRYTYSYTNMYTYIYIYTHRLEGFLKASELGLCSLEPGLEQARLSGALPRCWFRDGSFLSLGLHTAQSRPSTYLHISMWEYICNNIYIYVYMLNYIICLYIHIHICKHALGPLKYKH